MSRMRWLAALLAAVLLPLAAPGVAAAGPAPSDALTAQDLPTWQTNGDVWALAIVNGVTYVGGNFTAVRPPGATPGQQEVPRRYLAAFDSATGDLLAWNPAASSTPFDYPAGVVPDTGCTRISGSTYECATVWEIQPSPDKTKLFVAGDFSHIGGEYHSGLVAFTLPDGQVDPSFSPEVWGRVSTMAVTDSKVFLGGSFGSANRLPRSRLAAYDHDTGALLPWAPAADGPVHAMDTTDDGSRIIVGGAFNTLNGEARRAIGSIYTDTGVNAPWGPDFIRGNALVTSLLVDGDRAYITADAPAAGVSEGLQAVDVGSGRVVFDDGCKGASHSVAKVRGAFYVGSHSHDCSTMLGGFPEQYGGFPEDERRRYTLRAEVPAGTGAQLLHWFPHTDDGDGPRAMATDQDYLWIGGEFTRVNDRDQRGLTRFAVAGVGALSRGPETPSAPVVSALRPDRVLVAFQATEDRDDPAVEYRLIRDDNPNPIATAAATSLPWAKPWLSFVDTDVRPGEIHAYKVVAVDPAGNASAASRAAAEIMPQAHLPAQEYPKASHAYLDYSFGQSAGRSLTSEVGNRWAAVGSGVDLNAYGSLGSGARFSGQPGAAVVDQTPMQVARQASFEATFRTTTTRGGALLSIGDTNSTDSAVRTAQVLFMDDSGRLCWGVQPLYGAVVTSPRAYNDGQWHHVVATFDAGNGLRLYVDGSLVVEDATLNYTRLRSGFFRIGGEDVSDWPGGPSSNWFEGRIDEVAAYPYPLSALAVADHARAALVSGALPLAPAGLTAWATGPGEVILQWSPVSGAQGYEVYRNRRRIGGSASPMDTDRDVAPGTGYEYQVAAVVNGQEGSLSGAVRVTTLPLPMSPGPTPARPPTVEGPKKITKITVHAVKRKSRLKVRIAPDLGARKQWHFTVLKKKAGSWRSVKRKGSLRVWKTKGPAHVLTVDLPAGRYKVSSKPGRGYRFATSVAVRLQR